MWTWFGFGFNAFGQIRKIKSVECEKDSSSSEEFKVTSPINIACDNEDVGSCRQAHSATNNNNTKVKASWSRRVCLHLQGCGSSVCISGFGSGVPNKGDNWMKKSSGCTDAHISEEFLTLAFQDRIECWNIDQNQETPVWGMEVSPSNEAGPPLGFPSVPGGYITSKSPFYYPLSPQLRAVSVALGTNHVLLLTATGAVYTWGSSSHGQLGHGDLGAVEEPKVLEALWGLPISSVAAGSWHSVCISAGGDLYVWGWNESGQLGLPSQALRKQGKSAHKTDASDSEYEGTQGGEDCQDVFISIQAFPALLDITESCEVSWVSCGSRHTAAVTTTGDIYTWGWGNYGQLGHETLISLDEPRCVQFFKDQGLRVVDVVCGAWNTFVSAIEKEASPP